MITVPPAATFTPLAVTTPYESTTEVPDWLLFVAHDTVAPTAGRNVWQFLGLMSAVPEPMELTSLVLHVVLVSVGV